MIVLSIIKLLLRIILFLVFVSAPVTITVAQSLIINEVMASNANTIADEDGDFEDWIELYNHGNHSINLHGFGLSDDYDEPFRWYFPDMVIGKGEYLIVWASGKNRRAVQGGLHTSFSISSAGEEIILTAPDGTRLDELQPTMIPADVSIGRIPGDNESWYFFDQPTPGASNTTQYWLSILPEPDFSHQGGFYQENFELSLSAALDGTTIYYTLDGSEPDPQNTTGTTFQYKNQYPENPGDPFGTFLDRMFKTHVYTDPISISNQNAHQDPIHSINTSFTADPLEPVGELLHGTVVRARTFKENHLPSPVSTHTFLVSKNIHDRFQLPVISLSIPDSSLFDYNKGVYVAGHVFDNWRANNPDRDIWPGAPGNWGYRGEEWEKQLHIELFNPSGETELKQNLGFRIHGGWSRSNHKKSFRTYARNIYDTDNVINYEFFPNDKRLLDQTPSEWFKRLMFRAGGNDNDMILDVTAQALMQNTHVGVQRTTPAVHFINGAYWGLINIRDRQDRYHIAYEYDVDADNVIIIDAPYKLIGIDKIEEGVPGDIHFFNELFQFVTDYNMADPENYRLLNELIDIDSYIDYYITFIYLTVNDWGGHDNPGAKHFRFWRVRNTSTKAYHDGKWRVMIWDLDGAFSNYNRDVLTTVMKPANTPSRMLLNMLENPDFRNRFLNRFSDLMNAHFRTSRVLDKIEKTYELVEHEINHDHGRWNRNPVGGYNKMKSFAEHRPAVIRHEIMEVFDLPGMSKLTLRADTTEGYIRVNTINIVDATPGVDDASDWNGIYFHDVPVELEAVPAPGMLFSHWEGLPEGTPARTSIYLQNDTTITAHFRNTILHYWHFNDLPAANFFINVPADYSLSPGNVHITYPGTGDGFMDRTEGTAINAHMGADEGFGLRVRNPSNTRELIFAVPSTGYENLEFSYAVYRTNNGAQQQALYFSPDQGNNWHLVAPAIPVTTDYQLQQFDLGAFAEVNNNPDLLLRLMFPDDAAANSSGNNRFDNVVLKKATLALDTLNPRAGRVHKEYMHEFVARNGKPPYQYELISGRLPQGLNISSAGMLYGTPEETGTWSFLLEVVDQEKNYSRQIYEFSVFEEYLIHYWHFNDLPDQVFDTIKTDYSAFDQGKLFYQGSGNGFMDKAEGTELNSWQGVLAGSALRVRNPSAHRQLCFKVPSTIFQYLRLSFAVHRTSNGAQWQQLQYSVDKGLNWINIGDAYRITPDYSIKTFDLSEIEDTWNEPDLMLRILFEGPEAMNESGNNRFDNIALRGVVKPYNYNDDELFVFPNPVTNGIINLFDKHNIWIFNSRGQLILAEKNVNRILLPPMPSGLYIIRTDTGKYAKIIIP